MKKREAKFGQIFRHWLMSRSSDFSFSGAFELKQTTKDSISFDSVKEHQIDFLLASQSDKGLLYKIPDDSRGIKPFDFFFLKNSPAYVVIKFPRSFEIITISTFLIEKKRSKKKSLTSQRAKEISVASVNLRKK